MQVLGFILLCIIWGTTWLAIKTSVQGFPPFFGAGIRFMVALFALFFYIRIKGISLSLNRKELHFLAISAILMYAVDYEVEDVDVGDSATWGLNTNATWLGMDTATGKLTGIPTNAHVGSYWVNVTISDSQDAFDYHNFTLTVNNINDLPSCDREEVYTLEHPELLEVQLAFTRKVVTELREFDNLYYEVCNEPYFGGVTLQWQHRIIDEIGASHH